MGMGIAKKSAKGKLNINSNLPCPRRFSPASAVNNNQKQKKEIK
jgi:hypothetical protein